MAQNTAFKFGPVALTTTTTTNILNCTVTSLAGPVGFTLQQPYIILRKLKVGNKTNAAAYCGLWVGATGANAAGTELPEAAGKATAGALDANTGRLVPANGVIEIPGPIVLKSADFLVGGASAATTLTIAGDGEIGITAVPS